MEIVCDFKNYEKTIDGVIDYSQNILGYLNLRVKDEKEWFMVKSATQSP